LLASKYNSIHQIYPFEGRGGKQVRKSHFLIALLIICSVLISFTGCAGNRDSRRDATTIEDDYKSDRDIGIEQDRDRLDRGGY
jgi:hypothetical protein